MLYKNVLNQYNLFPQPPFLWFTICKDMNFQQFQVHNQGKSRVGGKKTNTD